MNSSCPLETNKYNNIKIIRKKFTEANTKILRPKYQVLPVVQYVDLFISVYLCISKMCTWYSNTLVLFTSTCTWYYR